MPHPAGETPTLPERRRHATREGGATVPETWKTRPFPRHTTAQPGTTRRLNGAESRHDRPDFDHAIASGILRIE